MGTLSSFCDEMLKIAVSREAARHTKGRQGRRSIRVHNLLKSAGWFGRPPVPPPSTMQKITKVLGGATVPLLGGVAGGAYLAHKGKQVVDKYRVGDKYMQQTGQVG